MDERIEKYGITEVSVRSYKLGESRPLKALENYFPPLDWIETEITIEREKVPHPFLPYEDRGWFLEQLKANIGLMLSARQTGSFDQALIHAIEVGNLLQELKLKFDWEADALRGRKIIEGASSTRIVSDDQRRAYIEKIMAERGKGKRDAFRIAAIRRPEWGAESTYRNSFYKNPSKASD
jgi:hypothetical protein